MVAVFIPAVELQLAVEPKLKLLPLAGHNDTLVRRLGGVDDLVRVKPLLGQRGQFLGEDKTRDQKQQHKPGPQPQPGRPASQDRFQQPGSPKPDQGVHHSEHKRSADQSQFGQKQNRKHQRTHQGPDVIEGQHAGDEFLKIQILFEDPHQERKLQANQRADREDHPIKQRGKPIAHAVVAEE